MDSSKLTFADLKRLRRKPAGSDSSCTQSTANAESAVNGFLRERGLSPDAVIGSVFRASYYTHVHAHCEVLRTEGRPKEYISNRRSLLTQWRRVVIEQDRFCAANLKQAHPFQRALLDIAEAGIVYKRVARLVGMPLATLKRWLDGRLPNARSAHYVPRLENILALTPGTLTDLLPFNVAGDGQNKGVRTIAYRERLKVATTETYAVKAPSEGLRREWAAFVEYKVAGSYIDPDDELSGRLRRSKSGKWFATSTSDMVETASNWHAFHDGLYVATANVIWSQTAQYIGWLLLPKEKGGKALPPASAMTLANLARGSWLRDYVRWQVSRSDGVFHGGTARFIKFARSLCNPRTGYLTQTWSRFRDVTSDSQETWLQRCRTTFEMLQDECSERLPTQSPSRDSFEPILHLLELDNPLEAVADMVIRMTARKPTGGGIAEAVWARNVLMVKLLMSNPIRDKNLRQLTFREDGTGHLRRAIDGSWSIFIPSKELKNRRGAGKRDYNKPVRREVWSDIEVYLRDYRPVLLRKELDTVFLSARTGGRLGEATLRRRFADLTKQFLQGCPGVGPHSMRHLVATSILKQCPGDWHVAAETLHDEVETVRAHYARFVKDDITRWQGRAMDGPFGRM